MCGPDNYTGTHCWDRKINALNFKQAQEDIESILHSFPTLIPRCYPNNALHNACCGMQQGQEGFSDTDLTSAWCSLRSVSVPSLVFLELHLILPAHPTECLEDTKRSHLHSPHLHFTAKVHSSFTSLCAAALLTFFHSRLTRIIILMVRDSLTSSSFSALKVHRHKSLDSRFIDTKLKII